MDMKTHPVRKAKTCRQKQKQKIAHMTTLYPNASTPDECVGGTIFLMKREKQKTRGSQSRYTIVCEFGDEFVSSGFGKTRLRQPEKRRAWSCVIRCFFLFVFSGTKRFFKRKSAPISKELFCESPSWKNSEGDTNSRGINKRAPFFATLQWIHLRYTTHHASSPASSDAEKLRGRFEGEERREREEPPWENASQRPWLLILGPPSHSSCKFNNCFATCQCGSHVIKNTPPRNT